LKLTNAAALIFLSAVTSCAADLDIKVGLWETTTTMQMAGLPNIPAAQVSEEALAKMPPEQRARIEAMMKSRVGGGTSPIVSKSCITRDSLAGGSAFSRQQNNCTSKVVTSTAAKQQVHVECDQQGTKMAGDLTVDRIDAEHTKGQMVMKGNVQSRPIETKMSFETKWLSAECGDVKPAAGK
jgi:hypothetical protein